MENLSLRPARFDDAAQVRALLSSFGLPSEDIGPHLDHFWLAEKNGALAGTVGLEVLHDSALLRSLAVSPSFRNQGIGSLLCDRVESYARSNGVLRLYLLTTTAEEFFKKRGYGLIQRDEVPKALSSTREFSSLCPDTAICMTKKLG